MRALMIREDVPPGELRRLAKTEDDPRVLRRVLAIAAALGGMSREAAARIAGMDRQTLRDWVIRYNRGGPAGLSDHWGDGRPCRLAEGQQATLKAIVLQGPDPERDGVSTWRLVDLCRIVRERFGVTYSETGMGRLMHDLDLSWQTPRPRHAETDRAAREAFKKGFAAALSQIAADHPEAERIEVWFQDEARVGQKGRMVRRRFQRGMRPRMVKGQRCRSACIFGAVCPARDTGAAPVLTHVSVAAMNLLLEEVAAQLPAGTHAAMLIGNAGWHTAHDLRVPPNITLVRLPPYSPELNAIEKVRQYLRDRYLAGRPLPGTRAVIEACRAAWNNLIAEAGRIRPLADFEGARKVNP
ncbi:IS630 family transposase [Caldovatus aquaticus]|uniref:IS630 family transposase n=1 Tax=Caldovatus aquaticus TaxID=2865671 RepID=A0ABS7F7B5_9PROT|nr:IS630 family transposase [Caldovatus aquaticus]MBW8271520.1 IS630 family transposase [Caldovatus aquaticus]